MTTRPPTTPPIMGPMLDPFLLSSGAALLETGWGVVVDGEDEDEGEDDRIG